MVHKGMGGGAEKPVSLYSNPLGDDADTLTGVVFGPALVSAPAGMDAAWLSSRILEPLTLQKAILFNHKVVAMI